MALDEAARDCQPEAGAADAPCVARLHLLELVEHPLAVRLGDRRARVPHRHADELDHGARRECLDLDASALGCELHGVGEEVRKHLRHAIRVRREPHRTGGADVDGDPSELAGGERQAPALRLRDVEEIVDDVVELLRRVSRHLQVAALLVGETFVVLLGQELERAADGRERRAQLVRDNRDELFLADLQRFLLDDVAQHDDHTDEAAVAARDGRHDRVQEVVADPHLLAQRARQIAARAHELERVESEALPQASRRHRRLLGERQREHAARRRVDEEDLPALVRHDDAVGHREDHQLHTTAFVLVSCREPPRQLGRERGERLEVLHVVEPVGRLRIGRHIEEPGRDAVVCTDDGSQLRRAAARRDSRGQAAPG